jgi:hypothetical protein
VGVHAPEDQPTSFAYEFVGFLLIISDAEN